MGSTKAQLDSDSVTPLDCIFACSVCGDVFSEIYQQRETVHGLSDGINDKERVVTRLYVTSCCHVICIKHIGGGNGPEFHQAGQQPQAPCPICVKESGDNAPRQLFSVRGFDEDEHDPAIPKFWFQAPPMKLEGKDKEMEALRFQYLALIRYSKNVTSAYKQAAKDRAEAGTKLLSMQEQAAEEHKKVTVLSQELERLRSFERDAQKLRRLEARLPAITHYLSIIPTLAEQNDRMQERLASLGFSMALEPIPPYRGPFPLDQNGHLRYEQGDGAPIGSRKTCSSHTVGSSAHNPGYGEECESPASSQPRRPLKRTRLDSPARANNIHAPSSRDMMPPPSKPLSKMRSIRKIIPTLRSKFSNGRSSPAPPRKPDSDPDVQMYDNDHWEDAQHPQRSIDVYERPPSRHGPQGDSPYMSGALPVGNGRSTNIRAQSGLLSGLGIDSNESEFTFETPSSTKMPKQRPNLPTEPSYIRLMDDLGHHTGLDLELEDPRRHIGQKHSPPHRTKQQLRQAQRNGEARNPPKQWNFGHAFLQQSPVNTNSTTAHHHSGSGYPRQVDAITSNTDTRAPINPITPTPVRSQRPATEVDHVVSPFFGNSNRHSRPFSRSQFAEPEGSSNRSAAYQSHHQGPSTGMDWCEPRSLNGLSFFSSPLNERNERIEWRRGAKRQQPTASVAQQRARTLNSQGLLIRPDAERSPIRDDSTYGSLDRSCSTKMPSHPHSAIPFPSFGRPPHSQASRLPSAMPSIIPSHYPARQKTQTENLGMLGVRSSQYSRPHIAGNTFASPMRRGFSSHGRRVIRR